MKFITLATLSLASLSFAAPAAQEEGAPAPTEAPAFPPSKGGSGADFDKIRSLIESFRSRRGGATGGAPFPRPTRRPTRSGSLPVPTGLSDIPGIGQLGNGVSEITPSEYEADEEEADEDEDDEEESGVAAPTGRRGGRRGGRGRGRGGRGGSFPTGAFPGFPRPTGGFPDFPAPTGGFPGFGDNLEKRSFDEAEEQEAGVARPTGRRGGRGHHHSHGGVFPTGGFPSFPRPTGGFSGFPSPTGSADDNGVETSSFGEEDVEQEAGVAAPTGRRGGRRGGRGRGRGGARPTGVFPTGAFPDFPAPTGGFPDFPVPTGGFGGEEGGEEVSGQEAGAAAPTGRRGGRRGGRGRGRGGARPTGVFPTGAFPGFPAPTGGL